MNADRFVREFKHGLHEARPYLLSHHTEGEFYRCYKLQVGSHVVRLCARCTGIYPGILAGIVLSASGIPALVSTICVCLFPVFALADWTVTNRFDCEGSNAIRTLTGFLLGTAYGLGLYRLLVDQDYWIVLLGLAYGLLAGFALWMERSKRNQAI